MALDGFHDELLQRALRALGDKSPSEVAMKIRAIVGPPEIPGGEAAAEIALEKLLRGKKPTKTELTALAVVIRQMRPVVFTRGGVLEDLPGTPHGDLQPADLKKAWSRFRKQAQPFIGSIGRIENSSHAHVGTGFVVCRGLIATNAHVLDILTKGSRVLVPESARIVFKQEIDDINSRSDAVPIVGVAACAKGRDLVFLSADTGDRPAIPFARGVPAAGARVAAIGYPGHDEVNNPHFLAAVFGSNFGTRRASLGEIRPGAYAPNFYHDCSTTRGNSGSPVLLLSTAKVAGIHRSGIFMYINEAIAASALRALIRTVGG